MICVSYTRMMSCSLLEQSSPDSISVQNERISKYVSSRKWKIQKKYSDRKADRNESVAFLALKEDGISGKFDCVVFDSMYRFGCTVYQAYDLLSLVFLPAEIHFAVVEDNFCSADYPKEEVLSYLKSKRSDYRKLHSKETTGRKLENRIYEKYGYRHKDGAMELVIDEEVADAIRLVFDLVASGKTMKQTADIMTAKGIEPPHLYMKRRGVNKNYSVGDKWAASQIHNIVHNSIYVGEWVRTVNCKKVTVPCPAIVSAEVFSKVQENILANKKASPANFASVGNALSGMLYDYDSGQMLYQYRKPNTGEKIYRMKYPKPETVNYEKMLISYDEVENVVVELLHKEQKKAKQALQILDTEEFRQYKEKQINVIRVQAKKIFERMMRFEFVSWQEQKSASEVTDEQRKNDEELQALLMQIEKIECILGADNPWIKLFANMKLSVNPTSTELKKYIVSATCEKFETVRINIKEKDAFLQLPQHLLKEE